MNWVEMESDWLEKANLVRTYWTQLKDEDLQQIAGCRDRLIAAIQLRCGMARGDAENAVCEFEEEVRLPGAVK